MNVIEITRPGGPEMLCPAVRPLPEPGAGQVRIRVAYAGVNRPDALQRAGAYDPPAGASPLPGLEASGVVTASGPGVDWPQVGDAVCALLPGGGYAEEALAQAGHCLPVPEGLPLIEAACLPETLFTVWSNVFMRGGLQAGERFLVHGGSSGIGTTAIQLARAFGAVVYATVGSSGKCAACRGLGATRAINYREEDFAAVLAADGGADVILDMVGGDYTAGNLSCLAPGGRLVQIGVMGGATAHVDLMSIMMRRLTLTGSTLRPQSDEAKAAIAAELREKVWPRVVAGEIRPLIDSVHEMDQAAEAHRRMESSAHIGKIVLRVTGG